MTTHGIRPYRVSSRIWMISLALATSLLATSALAEPPAGPEMAGQAQHSLLVNLNTADEGQLTALPGIGPSKAQAILKLRTRMKRFRRIEDLMRVRGVGRKTFRRLKPMLSVEGPSRGVPAPKAKAATLQASKG